MLQIKMNKDIMEYREEVYFGLTLRQLICSVLALAVAGILYFALRHHVGMEVRSWVCMLGAAPFAALGFFKYMGMTAEQFFVVWLRFLLTPRRLHFQTEIDYQAMITQTQHKEGRERHVKKVKKSISNIIPKR